MNLGLPLTKEDYNLSTALGGMVHGVTPINMAEAYSAFANGGHYYESYAIAKITDRKNKDYYVYHVPKGRKVMSEQTSYYMTEMLREVVTNGLGKHARIDGRIVAGKTGTTQHGIPGYSSKGDRDAWFVGYTPEWTAAVWMGYDKTDRNHVLYEGTRMSSKMFSEVMRKALQSKKSGTFKIPDKIEQKPEKLKSVSGLNASYSENSKSVILNWNGVSGDGITYRVYRKSSKDHTYTQLLKGLKGTDTEDIGVFPGETYTYYVTAANATAESGRSNEVSATVTEEQPVEPVVVNPPATEERNRPPSDSVRPEEPDASNLEQGQHHPDIDQGNKDLNGSDGFDDTLNDNDSNDTHGSDAPSVRNVYPY